MNQWIQRGAPAEKLVVGIATYGRTSHLADADNNGLKAAVTGPGNAGEFSLEAGILTYLEV